MRYILVVVSIILTFFPNVIHAEVYNMGKLEVSAVDLSSVELKRGDKKIDDFKISEGRRRVSRKLLNLGDDKLLAAEKNSLTEINCEVGSYTTVKVNGFSFGCNKTQMRMFLRLINRFIQIAG